MTPEEKELYKQMKVGDIVSLRYMGGRFVKGKVELINGNSFCLELHTDYIGKNEEWFAGEKKGFVVGQCKGFKILTPLPTPPKQ